MPDNYITRKMEKGSINISEDVVAALVKTVVMETDGVAELANAVGADVAELSGIKMNIRGVKVRFPEDKISVDVVITVKYGNNIVNVAQKVQEAVLSAVETSTGIEEAEVNVHVAGIAFKD